VGFTRIAEELSPAATAGMLNDVFTRFDDLADAHGVEKIKTVGDAYMAAVGLEEGSRGQSPALAASMALGMMKAVRDYTESDREIELRIGIATGPVVAGVIGRTKFIYDIWGDTVNIASRMASDAPAGAIQCDPATRWSLAERFAFDEGREVDVKGKGRMRVFRLLEDLPP
jgi:class 3 adenylate cyclase